MRNLNTREVSKAGLTMGKSMPSCQERRHSRNPRISRPFGRLYQLEERKGLGIEKKEEGQQKGKEARPRNMLAHTIGR